MNSMVVLNRNFIKKYCWLILFCVFPLLLSAQCPVLIGGSDFEDIGKVVYGGPMMGVSIADLHSPVLKQTNAVIFMGEKEATPPKVTPCIKCGACVLACPLSLDPTAISKAYKANEPQTLEKLKVDICMECGCCSYVCPAKRNIVQRNKMAKTMLREYKLKQKKLEEKKNG